MPAIGIFDSGVGGLTVLKDLRKRWPAQNFLYLADTARLPYGNKSLHTVHNYVEQNLKFLAQYSLKAVVVACNTASAALIESPIAFAVPVFNVIDPGARKALEFSARKRIGVLGTRATVYAEAYPKAIRRLYPEAQVFQQACPLWVPLVEEGWIDDPVTNIIVFRYASLVMKHDIDALILGCTHYPVLKDSIRKATHPELQLVDSSVGLIEDLSAQLKPPESGDVGTTKILCTDFSPRLEETVRLLLGEMPYDSIELVDI